MEINQVSIEEWMDCVCVCVYKSNIGSHIKKDREPWGLLLEQSVGISAYNITLGIRKPGPQNLWWTQKGLSLEPMSPEFYVNIHFYNCMLGPCFSIFICDRK